LTGPEEPEAKVFPASFALRALVTSCILLNFSWLVIISAQQIKANNLVKLLKDKTIFAKRVRNKDYSKTY
jgi:hypothetical protein